ncbi:hypothetical protein SSBR45G_54090 [Bradyrhizobium sp. SSBR45G]|uniref:DUF2946 family protein n=1 Tax=unclassified Bradyrhizobium TaxID=2631580 RepID=UPI0023428F2E|nr:MULTISPECIES: DUF2946 family protein [unclassified Bradyrhizobium]GLH80500.1 hypothetical protein SSBR45G_54090 [Bradyrhizobium sp. SSBR45G]GLH87895.1 hypothetical protein SSBR45R_53550 [Bradyrhizobium sp. SSBR45R]
MSWFRANIKDGSRLALFALLLQFALAFGHVHWLAGQAADGGLFTTAQAHTGSLPASQDSDQQPAADGCAICAVMAMAQSILLSPAPVLTVPDAVAFRLPDAIAATAAAVAVSTAFQPRAPPLA